MYGVSGFKAGYRRSPIRSIHFFYLCKKIVPKSFGSPPASGLDVGNLEKVVNRLTL
jgi:hypothetical protein